MPKKIPTGEPVNSKKDFVRRYADGEFGNASPTWNTLDEVDLGWLRRSGQLFHVRNRVAGAQTWYDVPGDKLADVWHEACGLFKPDNLYISAMCPTHKTVIQGEVQQRETGLYMFYTFVKKPMRDALREEARHAHGVQVQLLLRHFLDSNSLDWLSTLLDRYPGHVVEFTTLSTCWGTLPNFNTIFWEVRNY